ncbi:MAG: hypothetical protein ACREOO_14365 [bacterium]
MNRAHLIQISLKTALLFYAASAISQKPILWNGLSQDAYEVGFKFERKYDYAGPFHWNLS